MVYIIICINTTKNIKNNFQCVSFLIERRLTKAMDHTRQHEMVKSFENQVLRYHGNKQTTLNISPHKKRFHCPRHMITKLSML